MIMFLALIKIIEGILATLGSALLLTGAFCSIKMYLEGERVNDTSEEDQ